MARTRLVAVAAEQDRGTVVQLAAFRVQHRARGVSFSMPAPRISRVAEQRRDVSAFRLERIEVARG